MSRGASRTRANPPREEKSPERGRGAVQSKTSFADVSTSYWRHHRASLSGSLRRLLATPLQTLMTALVVAIALALPATLLVALGNVQQLGRAWDTQPKISVYINLRARAAAIEGLIARIESLPEVAEVNYLTAEQALADFQALSGFGDALSALEQNPLPATLVVTPASAALEAPALRALGERLAAEAIVDAVDLDMDWVRRLQALMLLGKKIVLALAGLLGLGVLLAVGNTIRLAIESRRDEILVIKLVGGSDGFVRRPFLYAGGWYGIFGGLLACAIVIAGHYALAPTVAHLALLYHSDFALQGLGVAGGLKLLLISTALGWIGAWLAVGRHLAAIEP